MNNFHEDLAEEQEMAKKSELWEDIYSSYFAGFQGHKRVTENGMQKRGVDRVIKIKEDKEVYVDEKIRDKDYGDALIEVYSDYNRKTKGWILKNQKTDYICYFIKPSKQYWIYDYEEIKSVFHNNRELLRTLVKQNGKKSGKVQVIKANNKGYQTLSVCIEHSYLQKLIFRNRSGYIKNYE